MPYGILKVDTITFTAGGVDTSVSISGLVQNPTFTGGITSTGTISGNIIQGGTTVSGATVTGTAGQFGTLTGNTAGFTTVTGATVTGTVAQFTTITGGTAGFTTVTGTTVTGTTANFATISGATVTGNAGSFTTVTGGVATITSGVFAAGTAALPSISISSDPNTGIFSPGADQLAISTNGTGRLFVDASGRLLVGTSSARSNFQNSSVTCRVQIEGTDYQNTGLAIISNDSSSVQRPVLYLYRNNGSTVGSNTVAVNGDMCGQVIFGANDGSEFVNAATITAEVDGTPGANDMPGRIVLSTTADGASSPTERLRITSAGLVGVGTSSVNTKFEIAGNNDAVTENNTLRFTDTDVSTEANQQIGKIEFYSSDASTPGAGVKAYIGAFAADTTPDAYLAFATQDGSVVSTPVERVRITSEGKVGIGTSSPSRQLSLSDTNPTATFRSTSTTGQCTLFFGDSDSDARGAITYENNGDKLGLWSAGGQKLTIDSSGNVGIGTTSPGGLLDVVGSSNTVVLSSNATDATIKEAKIQCRHYTNAEENLMLVYGASTSTDNAVILGGGSSAQNSATYISFLTAANTTTTSGTERARIDSSGRLLVGTSSGVAGTSVQIQGSSTSSAGGAVLYMQRGQGAGSITSGDTLGRIYFASNTGGVYAGIEAQTDGAGAESPADYPGRLVFSVTQDGSASPTERVRIENNGRRLHFSSNDGCIQAVSSAAGTSSYVFVGRHSSTSTTSGTDSFYVFSNGNVQNTNGSYTTISDIKLKENIVDAGSQWDDLKAIQIRNWNFKAETGHETHRQIGPIAQELEQVCPGLVFDTPDRDANGNETGEVTKGVNQSVLYMKAVKALQEAMERIEQLETEMAAVKAQLS